MSWSVGQDDIVDGTDGGAAAISDEGAREAVMEQESDSARMMMHHAAFGELAVLAMQHPSWRNLAIADLDWLIGPAVLTGNFLVLRQTRGYGPPLPVAAITWARVSDDIDARLMENPQRPFRLSPTEYVSGDICWLAHTFGPPQAVEQLIRVALAEGGKTEDGKDIPAGPLAGKALKQRLRGDDGRVIVVATG